MLAAAQIPEAIIEAAAQNGVPPSLALAVAQAESNLNPNAVSYAGAQGIFQLMPGTAAMLGVMNPYDPQQNINGGVRYLAQLLAQFGDPYQAVAAYNWGPGNVSNAISEWGSNWFAYAPAETQAYVTKILGSPPQYSAAPVQDLTPADASNDGIDVVGDATGGIDFGTALEYAAFGAAALVAWGALSGN
jgi:soluble lytic murein transglycosylase-like protein